MFPTILEITDTQWYEFECEKHQKHQSMAQIHIVTLKTNYLEKNLDLE